VELNEAVLALARAIHADGPDGWRTATVKLRCTPSGQAGWSRYDNRGWIGGGPAMRALEQDLAKVLLADRPEVVYELVVRSTGEVRIAYSYDFDGPTIVRDKDFRLPGHPLPGSVPMPEAIRITDAPTDPAVLSRIAAKIGTTEGRGEDEILATERELGFRLPEELRALHRLGCADIGEFRLATLEELVEWRTDEDTQFGGWDDDEPLGLDPVPDVWPHGHVKRLCRNDWWLPFAVDDNWCHLAVDLDPAEHGRIGQVIWFDEHTEMSGYVADSVGGVLPPWTWPDDASRPAEAVLRGEPTPDPHIQRVNANQRGDIDLASFAVLPNLRDLRVNGAGRVRAAALPGLEALKIEAREFDLAPLAGHPDLWSLTLSGLRHPVDARTIATMTSLIRLDLSDVEVMNIEALAALPNLRVVTLDGDQWDRVDLPELAVAALGKGTLAQQLQWLDRYAPRAQNRELHLVEALI
jgi:cell wall assembly regulator SMI1